MSLIYGYFEKIEEKAILNKILSNSQYGCRRGRSALMALSDLYA